MLQNYLRRFHRSLARPPRSILQVERLEERTLLSWVPGASLLTARAELAAAVGTDGLIYVVGGTNQNSGDNPDTAGDSLEAYDPASGSWTSLAGMGTSRIFLGLAAGPDGRIYAIGGFDPSTLQEITVTEAYSPATNTWSTVASPPLQHGFGLGPTVAVTGKDGKIYAFFHSYNDSGETCSVLAYDPVSDSWTTGAAVSIDNSGPTAATVGGDGRIYVLGGFTYPLGPGTTPSPKIEAYDPATNTWTAIPDDPVAQPLGAMAEGPDGQVYVMGGENANGSVMANANVYDPRTNSWSTADNLPAGREQLAAATTPDGRIYAIGGSTQGGFTSGRIGVQASGEVDVYSTTPAPPAQGHPIDNPSGGHAKVSPHVPITPGESVPTPIQGILPSQIKPGVVASTSSQSIDSIDLLMVGLATGNQRSQTGTSGTDRTNDEGARIQSRQDAAIAPALFVAQPASHLMTSGRLSQQLLDLLSGTAELPPDQTKDGGMKDEG